MKIRRLVVWMALCALVAAPASSLAAGEFVVFTELYVKRMLAVDQEFQTTILSVPFESDGITLVNTSAGMLAINSSWDIEMLFTYYDFTAKYDPDGIIRLVVAISTLEFSELQDDLLILTKGSSAFKESLKMFDAIVEAMNEHRSAIDAGENALVYSSNKYNYYASLGYDSERNRTSAITLTIKKAE